jgi:hypothetical protein
LGDAHFGFLRRFLSYDWGIPSGRWLNLLMNRIDPELFAACFPECVRKRWPNAPDTIAIDGKRVRRTHDRYTGRAALHLVCAFASDRRLVLGQEAVDGRSDETTAIPSCSRSSPAAAAFKRLVTIDAIACNPQIATTIRDVGADCLLAVKGNQPILQADIEAAFEAGEAGDIEVAPDIDTGHGRIETRVVSVMPGRVARRRAPFPGELRFRDARALVKIDMQTELKDRCRFDAGYSITSSAWAQDQNVAKRRSLCRSSREFSHEPVSFAFSTPESVQNRKIAENFALLDRLEVSPSSTQPRRMATTRAPNPR